MNRCKRKTGFWTARLLVVSAISVAWLVWDFRDPDSAYAQYSKQYSKSPVTVQFQYDSFYGSEASACATVTVTLSEASSAIVRVKFSTQDGTATAPADYQAITNLSIVFNPGETSKEVAITLVDDSILEPDETVCLKLESPENATLGSLSQSTLFIFDDDTYFNLTVLAGHEDPVPFGPVDTGLPVQTVLSAWVMNPPVATEGHSIVGPYWSRVSGADSWNFTVLYRATDTDNFAPATPGSYLYIIKQDGSSSADATLTFVGVIDGYWLIEARPYVTYTDNSFAVTWKGEGLTSLSQVTMGTVPFTFEGKPDVAWALRNEYLAQKDPCEVLKGWKARYTAPEDGVDWYFIQVNDMGTEIGKEEKFGTGRILEFGETTVQAKKVYYKKDNVKKGDRIVRIGDFESPVGDDGFTIVANGDYTKRGMYQVVRPGGGVPAVSMRGKLRLKADTPTLKRFQWGLVQNIGGFRYAKYDCDITFFENKNPNAFVVVPTYFQVVDMPAGLNDSTWNHQLYANLMPIDLVAEIKEQTATDTPTHALLHEHKVKDSDNKDTMSRYELKSHQSASWRFTAFLVVFHKDTQQYVTVRQRDWKLDWSTLFTQPDKTWKAGVEAETQPTNYRAIPNATNSVEASFQIPFGFVNYNQPWALGAMHKRLQKDNR